MSLVKDLHHVSLLVASTLESLRFYQGVLDLEVLADRPDLPFPGAWLRVGAHQIHLLELPNPDPTRNRPAHGGRDRHVALTVASLETLVRRLDVAGFPYTLSLSGRRALFCRDPDGNALEFIEDHQ